MCLKSSGSPNFFIAQFLQAPTWKVKEWHGIHGPMGSELDPPAFSGLFLLHGALSFCCAPDGRLCRSTGLVQFLDREEFSTLGGGTAKRMTRGTCHLQETEPLHHDVFDIV